LTFADAVALGDENELSTLMSVADETNQNLSLAQKELLLWHWKMGHANQSWIQHLTRKTKDTIGVNPVLKMKHGGVSSCSMLFQ
jgi:hypothetical protein